MDIKWSETHYQKKMGWLVQKRPFTLEYHLRICCHHCSSSYSIFPQLPINPSLNGLLAVAQRAKHFYFSWSPLPCYIHMVGSEISGFCSVVILTETTSTTSLCKGAAVCPLLPTLSPFIPLSCCIFPEWSWCLVVCYRSSHSIRGSFVRSGSLYILLVAVFSGPKGGLEQFRHSLNVCWLNVILLHYTSFLL